MSEIVLINITGKDRKGLDAKFTNILAQYNVNILDIGQAVIHQHISLGILAQIPEQKDFALIFKDMLFEGHNMGLQIDIKPINLKDYEKWVHAQGKEKRIITMLGRNISARQISCVAEIISKNNLNIDYIKRLTGRISLKNPIKDPRASVQMCVSGTPLKIHDMRKRFMEISQEEEIDISFHVDNIYMKNMKLVVFDMDSTLIQAEVIDEVAALANKKEEVSKITESAMRGEIDFDESFKKRVALLKGVKEESLQKIPKNLPLTDGLELVTKTLKGLGYKLGILSGGFSFVGEYLNKKFHFDYMYANKLDVENGVVTGKIVGEIVNGEQKARLLRQIAQKEQIVLDQTIAIGDGANDLPMISIAGLGVAFNAKPTVKSNSASHISNVGLEGLLYLIGLHEREIREEVHL